jgi:anion transporter
VITTSQIDGQILAVVFLALVTWSLFPRHHLISSIIIIALLSLLQASISLEEFIDSLFSTYGGSGLWIIISGFILASAMETSGLARRIALWIVTTLGGEPNRVILSVAIANLAVAPLSPSTTAKAFLLLPICNGLIESFNVEKGKSNFGAAVMLMSMAANNICSTGFLTATVPNPISAEAITSSSGIDLGWFGWLKMAFPLTVILLVLSWMLCKRIFQPEVKATSEAIERIKELKSGLKPISYREALVIIIFSIALLLWITDKLHNFNSGLLSLLLCLIFFIPRIGVIKIGGFAKGVPWNSIALFAASMFLAKAVDRWKAFNPVAISIFNILGLSRLPNIFFISFTILVTMFLHIAFTSTTVFATVMVPLTISLTKLQGLPTHVIAIPIAFLTPIAVILPINTIPNVVYYSSGYFTQKQIITYGLILSILSVIIILIIGLPYWQLSGLI